MTNPVAIDPSLNPLLVKLGTRVKTVREARGMTGDQVAKQLGIENGAYPLLEQGRLMPAPWLQERIRRWMWEGVSFQGHRRGETYRRKAIGHQWRPIRLMLEPALRKKLAIEAGRVGLTSEELAAIAVDRLLSAPASLTTLKAAQELVRKVQMVEALKNFPDLRAVLEGDMELAVKVAGPEIKPGPPEKYGMDKLIEDIEPEQELNGGEDEPETYEETEELT